MQEQAPYKITPEQGWSQMKSVLDREMPVQKRSRRIIYFWWSLAGMTLVGLAGAFALRSDFVSTKSNSTPVPQVAPKQTEPAQGTQPAHEVADKNNEFAMNTPKEKSITTNSKEVNNNSSADKKRASASSSKAVYPDPPVSTSNHASLVAAQNTLPGNNTNTTSADQVNAIALNENTTENVSKATSMIQGDRNEEVTESIASLDMAYFTIPENELGPIQASEFTRPSNHTFSINPGVEANVLSGFNGGTGWYAGAGAELKLSSTWSLTAGLGYRSFDPRANLFSSSKADLAADINNSGLVKIDSAFNGFYVAGESINTASYQDLDPVIESLHQWQAQVGVDWKFSKRFSVESGFGLAFHTTATSEYPIVAQSYATPTNAVRFSNSLEGYDVIRQTMTSVYAGVSYHIGRHIAVKAQWLHTFQPYLNTDNNTSAFVSSSQRDDYLRGITLGMKYSFL